MYLIFYTLVGDGGDIREVQTRAVTADNADQAVERLHRRFGAGYAHIVKVERA